MQSDQLSPYGPISAIELAGSELTKAVDLLLDLGLCKILNLRRILHQIPEDQIEAIFWELRDRKRDEDRLREHGHASVVSETSRPNSLRYSTSSSRPNSYRLSTSSSSTNNRSSAYSSDLSIRSFAERSKDIHSISNRNSHVSPLAEVMDAYSLDTSTAGYYNEHQALLANETSQTQQAKTERAEFSTKSVADVPAKLRRVKSSISAWNNITALPESKPKPIPCPEIDCNHNVINAQGLERHALSRHTDGHFYECKHPQCFNISYSDMDCKNHHKRHQCKRDHVDCRAKLALPDKKIWACSICACHPFGSVKQWAKHYAHHFLEEGYTRKDVNLSVLIRNLLEQEQTQLQWHQQRAMYLGADLYQTVTWDKDNVEVRSLIFALSGGYSGVQNLGHGGACALHSLVYNAVRLAELPDSSEGFISTAPKRRATSSPSKLRAQNNEHESFIDNYGDIDPFHDANWQQQQHCTSMLPVDMSWRAKEVTAGQF